MTVRRYRAGPAGEPRLYERRPVWKLRLSDLNRIPDPESNRPLIERLAAWIAAGSPPERPPIGPSGAPVRRVRLLVTGSTGIPREGLAVNGGVAAFGDIARLDIYYGHGRYVAVPVARAEIATRSTPPTRALVPGALRGDWMEIDGDFVFCFSLHRGAYVEIRNHRGVAKAGFIRSFDTYKGQLYLTPPEASSEIVKVAIHTARLLRKFTIDRLGRRSLVRGEALTWRGRTVAPRRYVEPNQEKTSLREVA